MEKENLTKLYKAMYTVTVEMSRLTELEDFDGMESLLNVKDELIIRINEAKSKITFSENEKDEFNSFVNVIKELENKNLEIMESKHKILKEKISSANKESKVLSSYKGSKEIAPAIIDERGA
ncbi:MAG: hypothetical protein PHC34_07340 [Candidatus Gastranaerophilales bacterium]|nr:hypothetical protein [Candidatus Gastranaerophilales bacterium]